MGYLPNLQKENPDKDTERYRTSEFPSILSKMQTRNAYSYTTIQYISYQRARRTDAEPITCIFAMQIIGSFFFLILD